jgi:DNA-directed RNA polymerase subunit RPC12/RpoP
MNMTYSCPKCGKPLVYDGMLVWRSGPRPPRNLASKNVGFSPRADYERERIYHCDHCGAEFWEDVEQRYPHLYEEGARGKYVYSAFTQSWESPSPGRTSHKKDTKRST